VVARVILTVVAATACGCDLLMPSAPDARRPAPASGDAGVVGDEAVAAHNAVRAAAVPTPVPPLAPLSWSDPAAKVAHDWAAQCNFGHSFTDGYGENIYASTATGDGIGEAVAAWASESSDYDYASNGCAAGRVCGHYTQLVWRESSEVGCASQVCEAGSPFGGGRWLIWVCDYAPPGNLIGARPY
jgi:uncharacterized protein YkwD